MLTFWIRLLMCGVTRGAGVNRDGKWEVSYEVNILLEIIFWGLPKILEVPISISDEWRMVLTYLIFSSTSDQWTFLWPCLSFYVLAFRCSIWHFLHSNQDCLDIQPLALAIDRFEEYWFEVQSCKWETGPKKSSLMCLKTLISGYNHPPLIRNWNHHFLFFVSPWKIANPLFSLKGI